MNTTDRITASQFLQALFSNIQDGWLEVTCIAPPKSSLYGPKVGWLPMPVTNWSGKTQRWVDGMNAQGYGIYFGLAVRANQKPAEQRTSTRTGRTYWTHPRGNEQDALYITALWADLDDASDDAYDRLVHFRPVPSLVNSSGGGFHGFWLLREPLRVTPDNLPTIKRTLAGIAKALNGDSHVQDLARVFRLPETINTKPERNGARCEVIDFEHWTRYDFADFAQYELLTTPRLTIRRELPDDMRLALPRWVSDYIQSGAVTGERNNRLYAATIEYRANGHTFGDAVRDLQPRALGDGLDESEIERTMQSAWRSSAGSMNVPSHLRAIMASDDAGGAL